MGSYLIRLVFILGLSAFSVGLSAQLQLPSYDSEIEFTPTLFSPSNFLQKSTITREAPFEATPLPVLFKVSDLPVFCRVEVEIEKAVSFPVKFRLGSVEHVDWLEGKGRDTYLDKQ
jgi:hypothetical protein